MHKTLTSSRGLSCVIGALLAIGCNGFVGEWGILDGFASRFAKVEPGHTRNQVVATLGEPARESGAFELPQREGYERLFEGAHASRSSRFLYWNTGVDEVAVVGLNEQGEVAFKCRAGT